MWTKEMFFSTGDLNNLDYYFDELRKRGVYSLDERKAHLEQVQKRISVELALIADLADDGLDDISVRDRSDRSDGLAELAELAEELCSGE